MKGSNIVSDFHEKYLKNMKNRSLFKSVSYFFEKLAVTHIHKAHKLI